MTVDELGDNSNFRVKKRVGGAGTGEALLLGGLCCNQWRLAGAYEALLLG
jgi:hypothetical protein